MLDFLKSETLNDSPSNSFKSIYYQLGEHTLCVNYSENINWGFKRTLRHIEKEYEGDADLTIDCIVVNANFKFPFKKEDYGDQGLLSRFNDEYHYSLFHHGVEAYSFYDRASARGYYLVKDPEIIPFWEFCAPFKYIIHWWCKDFDYQLVHGAFLKVGDLGFLLSGKGGSGKSTTTIGMILDGAKTLGEDYLLVDSRKKIAYSLYNTAKLDIEGLRRFPEVKGHVDEKLIREKEKKTFFHMDDLRKNALTKKQKIDFHILPTVRHASTTEISLAKHSEGVKRLAPSTIFQLPRLKELTFKKCALLCRNLSTYDVSLGSDPGELNESLKKIGTLNAMAQ